jgi:hypothetical protein
MQSIARPSPTSTPCPPTQKKPAKRSRVRSYYANGIFARLTAPLPHIARALPAAPAHT